MGLRFTHPFREQVIGIFSAVGRAQRDLGEGAQERRGQGALRIDGEDHRSIKALGSKAFDHGTVERA